MEMIFVRVVLLRQELETVALICTASWKKEFVRWYKRDLSINKIADMQKPSYLY